MIIIIRVPYNNFTLKMTKSRKDIKSPLLILQEYNTDVWEMIMIGLVKARMKKVITHFKELCDRCDSDTTVLFEQDIDKIYIDEKTPPDIIKEYLLLRKCMITIHPGRIIISIIMGHFTKEPLRPITYESKYFVYGFYLEPSKNSFKMELRTHHLVVNVLDALSRLNNYEFDRTDDNATIHDLVLFLYEREEQIENDTHIYCMVKNEIIP